MVITTNRFLQKLEKHQGSVKKLLLFYSDIDFLAFIQPQYDLEIDSVVQIIMNLIPSLSVPEEYYKMIDQLTQNWPVFTALVSLDPQRRCHNTAVFKMFTTVSFRSEIAASMVIKNGTSLEVFSTAFCKICQSSWISKPSNIRKYLVNFRSSRPEVFCRKGVLKNFAKFSGKHLYQSLFISKVADLRPATLLKKRLQNRCFPVNFVKFLRTAFFIEHCWWLLLKLGGLEKKELCYRCFPENIFKFFWTAIPYSCNRHGMQRCH